MLSAYHFPLKPVAIDKDNQYFLPVEFADKYGCSEDAIRSFMLADIFKLQGGKYLPQSNAFLKVLDFAKKYLQQDEKKLSQLFFHNHCHTFHPVKGVIAVALKLAIVDGISYEDVNYERIGISAALHDIGNIIQRQKHEEISIDDSRQFLCELGYSKSMIDGVANCIFGTEIKFVNGSPVRTVYSRDAKILSDADLNNPGFSDATNFACESIKLWLELGFFDIKEFPTKGVELTHHFFSSIGEYYTGAARYLFSERKKQNMEMLASEVEKIMRQCSFELPLVQQFLLNNDKQYLVSEKVA